MNFLEIEFSLRGQTLPIDHGYFLYSSVKSLCHKQQPTLLNDNNLSSDILLSSISGIPGRSSMIYLNKHSRFRLRCPAEDATQWYRFLQNQVLDIRGHLIRLVQPRLTLPKISSLLKARLVVFHLQQWNTQESPLYFLESCQKALEQKNIQGKVFIDSNSQGDLALRTIQIKDRKTLGYGVIIEGLSGEDSLKLQGYGLGGRKHFGCGWFYPIRENDHAE